MKNLLLVLLLIISIEAHGQSIGKSSSEIIKENRIKKRELIDYKDSTLTFKKGNVTYCYVIDYKNECRYQYIISPKEVLNNTIDLYNRDYVSIDALRWVEPDGAYIYHIQPNADTIGHFLTVISWCGINHKIATGAYNFLSNRSRVKEFIKKYHAKILDNNDSMIKCMLFLNIFDFHFNKEGNSTHEEVYLYKPDKESFVDYFDKNYPRALVSKEIWNIDEVYYSFQEEAIENEKSILLPLYMYPKDKE